MENVKQLVYDKLVDIQETLTRVQNVKSFITSDKALVDAEKIVFKDAAIALGDYSFQLAVYGVGWDKVTHKIEILYLIKSENGFNDSADNMHKIAGALRRADFGKDSLLKAEVSVAYRYIQLTDKVHYAIIDFSVIELQSR